jgi:hypothetical protein
MCKKTKAYRDTHKERCKEIRKSYYEKCRQNPSFVELNKQRAKEYYHEHSQNRNRALLDRYKTPCVRCGNDTLPIIEYHHVYPQSKECNVGGAIAKKDAIKVAYEIGKCVCLCRNCHAEFHYKYGKNPKNPKEDLEEFVGKSVQEMANERTII